MFTEGREGKKEETRRKDFSRLLLCLRVEGGRVEEQGSGDTPRVGAFVLLTTAL